MNTPSTIWISTFGLGFRRPAPGTWGSLPPAVLGMLLLAAGCSPGAEGAPAWIWRGVMLAVVVVFSLACVLQGDAAEAVAGKKDPSLAVADETAGMALTLALMPASLLVHGAPVRASVWIGIAFVLFRLMDIIKPPPARGLQRVPGGWGILIDDLIAGLYAVGVIWAWSIFA